MKKTLLISLTILILLLGACTGGLSAKETEFKTVYAVDDRFSIDVPESWIYDSSYSDEVMQEQFMILNYTDYDTAFMNMYFYDSTYDYDMNDALDYALSYFGDNIIGEYEEMRLDGMDVYYFETSMIDISVDGDRFNYHGYYYIFDTPYGIAEIDIYYSQEIIESKIFKPSKDQLELLQEIAESFEVY